MKQALKNFSDRRKMMTSSMFWREISPASFSSLRLVVLLTLIEGVVIQLSPDQKILPGFNCIQSISSSLLSFSLLAWRGLDVTEDNKEDNDCGDMSGGGGLEFGDGDTGTKDQTGEKDDYDDRSWGQQLRWHPGTAASHVITWERTTWSTQDPNPGQLIFTADDKHFTNHYADCHMSCSPVRHACWYWYLQEHTEVVKRMKTKKDDKHILLIVF